MAQEMNVPTKSLNQIAPRGMSILGLLSEYGPNMMQLNTSLTLAEVHQFLGYNVELEILPRAEGPIADILRAVQRPASKDRQNNIGTYQENYLLKPQPLDESTEQGFMPAVTLLANRPLHLAPVANTMSQMGQELVVASKEDEDTIVIPSDGVGRLTGLENRERLYSKSSADLETRRLRTALQRLRVPTLILFPRAGELTELHMQQAVYDMNVLATPLTATMALNRDNRSPYNAVVKAMLADTEANLKHFDSTLTLKSMIRFVKIALEGSKAAEKAGASGEAKNVDVSRAANELTWFWSVFTKSMAPGTLKVKDNMATGAPGIAALALVAHEFFYGRAERLGETEKTEAIRKLGAIDWLRSRIDAEGNVTPNKTWLDLGLCTIKPDGNKIKVVMGGAGANNSRNMTSYLLKIVGIEKPTAGDVADVEEYGAALGGAILPEMNGAELQTF
jgi:hypothetical protein